MARGPRNSQSPGDVADHNRTMQAVAQMGDAITNRLEELFASSDDRLERIERRVSTVELSRGHLLSEIAEIRRDQGEMRALMAIMDADIKKHTSEENDRKVIPAVEQVPPQVKKTLADGVWKRYGTPVAVVGVVWIALAEVADKAGKVLPMLERIWAALGGSGAK